MSESSLNEASAILLEELQRNEHLRGVVADITLDYYFNAIKNSKGLDTACLFIEELRKKTVEIPTSYQPRDYIELTESQEIEKAELYYAAQRQLDAMIAHYPNRYYDHTKNEEIWNIDKIWNINTLNERILLEQSFQEKILAAETKSINPEIITEDKRSGQLLHSNLIGGYKTLSKNAKIYYILLAIIFLFSTLTNRVKHKIKELRTERSKENITNPETSDIFQCLPEVPQSRNIKQFLSSKQFDLSENYASNQLKITFVFNLFQISISKPYLLAEDSLSEASSNSSKLENVSFLKINFEFIQFQDRHRENFHNTELDNKPLQAVKHHNKQSLAFVSVVNLNDDFSDRIQGTDSSSEHGSGENSYEANPTNGDKCIDDSFSFDVINGQRGDDALREFSSNDTLHGCKGKDFLLGQAGDDWLVGSNGNDLLNRETGDNILYNGSGHNNLQGSSGSDLFVLESGKEAVIITDFTKGLDLIGLSGYLQFDNLDITQEGNDSTNCILTSTFDNNTNEILAGINNIATNTITEYDFNVYLG